MSITSQKNITMLRALLNEHPLLQINKDEFEVVFDREINRIHQNRFTYRSNLIDMNKELLKTFQRLSIQFKKEEDNRIAQEKIVKQTMHEKFLRQQRIEKRKAREEINFEQKLSDTRADFTKVMAGKRPEEIDFTEKVQDTPIKSNQIDLTMSQREAELAEIMNKQPKNKKVQEWLQTNNNNNNNNDSQNTINLKIDHSSNIPVNVDPIPGKPILKRKISREDTNRRVHFKVQDFPENNQKNNEEVTDLDFFQKLKLKNERNAESNIFNNEMKDILKNMCDNQLTIIEELKKLNKGFSQNMERNDKINKVEHTVSELVEDEFEAI